MCHFISQSFLGSRLGYLDVESSQQLHLRIESFGFSAQFDELLSLESFVQKQPSREKRLRVGLSIVFLVYGIGPSKWLSSEWTPAEISLMQSPGSLVPQPYVFHPSLIETIRRASAKPTDHQRRSSFFNTGIMLLELLFGMKLNDHPDRRSMLDDDGNPNKMTDFCTAMKWNAETEEKFGDLIANAIQWCLACFLGFGISIDSLAFLDELWEHVVVPLERFLALWSKSPIT
ncbi:hypothetical protein C8035_v010762 [Colletotrichum spinosum]|uniref:DUF7580 domain-containing protein n=1 Tax=Colletotrichum spinosum TaxID=1347390 RepID=A0A4R8QBU3_9PEZI|nr:hypothetical protein C8035_v010762 [Colletotrichum spinosum]